MQGSKGSLSAAACPSAEEVVRCLTAAVAQLGELYVGLRAAEESAFRVSEDFSKALAALSSQAQAVDEVSHTCGRL